jgi:hypothetical protein
MATHRAWLAVSREAFACSTWSSSCRMRSRACRVSCSSAVPSRYATAVRTACESALARALFADCSEAWDADKFQ